MATKKYLSLEGLSAYDELIKAEVDAKLESKADISHNHDDVYETKEDARLKYDEFIGHEHSWDDLTDKPFEMNTIIERSTYYEGTSDTNMFGCRFYGTNLSNILDKAVVVTLNGVTYNSECVIDSATVQCAISFGDYKITEPIAGGEGVASLTPFEDGKTYSIKIEVIKEISTIPDKHIPDTIAKTTYVDEAISNHTHYLENIIDNPFETQQSMIISSKTEVLAETECSNLANTEHWIHESDYYIEFYNQSKLYQVVFAGDTYNLHPVLEDEDSMIYSLGDKDYNTYPFYIKYYSDEWFTEYYFQEYSSNDTISIYECIASSEDVCVLPISNGGTGATDATTARTNLEVYSIAEVDTALESLRTNIDNIDLSGYETKDDAQSKYDNAVGYTDEKIANLLENSTEAVDSIFELRDAMNENADAIEALTNVAASKVPTSRTINGKALTDDITLSASDVNADASGSSDAVQANLDSHDANTTKHITSTERTNWNTAKSHADSAHAPVEAQENIIESIEVNGTAQTVANKSVNITVPTEASDIGAAPATHGHAISDITDLQTTLNNAASAIGANTSSIGAHNDRISALETKVGDGFEEITSTEIQNLFK